MSGYKRLKSPDDLSAEVFGSRPDNSVLSHIDQFHESGSDHWQLRIPLRRDRANLAKAAQTIQSVILSYDAYSTIAFEVMIPTTDGALDDPLFLPPERPSAITSDKRQFGKELNIYMSQTPAHAIAPETWRAFILDIWKALQTANVRFGECESPFNEMPIYIQGNGITLIHSPFYRSADKFNKEERRQEKRRHGELGKPIMHPETDPLKGQDTFTLDELVAKKINVRETIQQLRVRSAQTNINLDRFIAEHLPRFTPHIAAAMTQRVDIVTRLITFITEQYPLFLKVHRAKLNEVNALLRRRYELKNLVDTCNARGEEETAEVHTNALIKVNNKFNPYPDDLFNEFTTAYPDILRMMEECPHTTDAHLAHLTDMASFRNHLFDTDILEKVIPLLNDDKMQEIEAIIKDSLEGIFTHFNHANEACKTPEDFFHLAIPREVAAVFDEHLTKHPGFLFDREAIKHACQMNTALMQALYRCLRLYQLVKNHYQLIHKSAEHLEAALEAFVHRAVDSYEVKLFSGDRGKKAILESIFPENPRSLTLSTRIDQMGTKAAGLDLIKLNTTRWGETTYTKSAAAAMLIQDALTPPSTPEVEAKVDL